MLLVPVKVGPSAIHGLGVFARAPIAKGTVVWRFMPGLDLDLDPAAIDALPPLLRDVLMHYGYVDVRLQRYILCADDARFMNHSDQANTASDASGDPYGIDIAVRDIAAGEELTSDYSLFEARRPTL